MTVLDLTESRQREELAQQLRVASYDLPEASVAWLQPYTCHESPQEAIQSPESAEEASEYISPVPPKMPPTRDCIYCGKTETRCGCLRT